MTDASAYPDPGEMMPDFALPASNGQRIRISDFRGDRNLVLVFVGEPGAEGPRRLLAELSQRRLDLLRQEALVLPVVQGSMQDALRIQRGEDLPFAVLADEEGRVHRQVGAETPAGGSGAALYITDRYNQVYMANRQSEGHPLPSVQAILARLEYIEYQCPE